MARAQFHKNQRVYVRPVGTWALIERVVPQWTKGLEEPLRIFYDVGLGRDFGAEELQSDSSAEPPNDEGEQWRVVRARNKWQSPVETANHPYPGTHPVVITGEAEWGGWRVPGAEYALSPDRIESQARLIASLPQLGALLKKLVAWAQHEQVPPSLLELVAECREAIAYLDSGVD
ncbi:MAG TPA: hypothetical protein VNH44_01110 [Micropepsaceae bacterium]|nr:hypothetical protein [Micropepsaceae bacterium]